MQSQHHDKMACTTPHPTPVVRLPLLDSLKRKRDHDGWRSPSPAEGSPSKRQRPAVSRHSSANPEVAVLAPTSTAPPKSQHLPEVKVEEISAAPTTAGQAEQKIILPIKSMDVPQRQSEAPKPVSIAQITPALRAKAMDKIESQINLETLLKHNELRLIEQELAKCQVALEQLRRCHVIPYPGHTESPITAEQISTGTGPALEPAAGLSHPEHAAPWGITDGPYTRHYARWLIPDAAFDPAPPPPPRQHVARKSVSGRATRRPDAEKAPVAATRAPRASNACPLYSLPSNYPVPKDRNSPLIATRPSDGKLVKLVCKFCGKDNVSSMQGFLNHCRIQHKHEYTSHGAAAEDCGVLLEEGDLNTASVISNELPTPVSATVSSSNKPFVHPLIVNLPRDRQQSSALPTPQSGPATPAKSEEGVFAVPQKPAALGTQPPKLPSTGVIDTNRTASLGQGPFIPSPLTPGLSALLQRRGVTGDMQTLVQNVKDRSDFDNICEQLPSDDEDDEAKPTPETKPLEQKPAKPRQPSKPKVRRSSVQQSRASSGAPAAPLRIKIITKPTTAIATPMCESPASFTPTMLPNTSSTVDFALPNYGPVPKSLDASALSPALPNALTPTKSEHSPKSVDHMNMCLPPNIDETMLESSSPHTIETDPGLVSDRGDEEDEDRLTFATISVDGEEASSNRRHDTVEFAVRRNDGEHEHRRSSQDHGDHQVDGLKSSESTVAVPGREGFVSVARGGRRGGRGRQRGGSSSGTGRSKGDARRTKQNP